MTSAKMITHHKNTIQIQTHRLNIVAAREPVCDDEQPPPTSHIILFQNNIWLYEHWRHSLFCLQHRWCHRFWHVQMSLSVHRCLNFTVSSFSTPAQTSYFPEGQITLMIIRVYFTVTVLMKFHVSYQQQPWDLQIFFQKKRSKIYAVLFSTSGGSFTLVLCSSDGWMYEHTDSFALATHYICHRRTLHFHHSWRRHCDTETLHLGQPITQNWRTQSSSVLQFTEQWRQHNDIICKR